MNPSIDFAFVSDIGMRRLNNQDSHLELVQGTAEVWRSRGHLFVVADGMGAHAAGELASKMAVEGVSHHYCQHRQLSPPEAILKAVREANTEIHQRGQANSEFHNMGTTCSSLLLLPQGALVAHVGDSRVYRLRGTKFQQLTFDHSLVWEMQATGQIDDTDASINIPKNVITRSLGPQPQVQVDLEGPFAIQLGDTFMLCSDGLTGKIRDDELGLILGLLPPNEVTAFCADLANLRGGPDNITMTVAKVVGDDMSGRRRCEPLTVGAELTPDRQVHVGVWVVMAVSWIVAAGLVVSTLYWLALAAFLVGAVAIPIAIWQSRGGSGGIALVGGRRLGRGPYVTLDCPVTAERMELLYRAVHDNFRQYSEALVVDRSRVKACLSEARTRSAQGEHREGMRMLAVAVNVFANSLRSSRDSNFR